MSAKKIIVHKLGYGYQIWLNTGSDLSVKHYPSAPSDLYYADGFESQFIFVITSKKLVIVRLGLSQNNNFNADQFLHNLLACIK